MLSLPETLNVALKEWDAVCQALARGQQVMLLRKGGIHESGGEFALEHPRFLLFPTYLHQDAKLLKPQHRGLIIPVASEPLQVTLSLAAEVTDVIRVQRLELLQQLRQEHVWEDELIRMRWNYRPENPLYVLLLRVFSLSRPQTVANTIAYAGCRSWVELDQTIPAAGATAVLSDAAYAERCDRVLARLK